MRPCRPLQTSPYLLVEALNSRVQAVHRQQYLDANQANKLHKTVQHLGLYETPELNGGDLLPPCYHMAYFTPNIPETRLSLDGADRTFNPGEPFTRRMWAGGRLLWNADNPLRLGQTVTETTTLDRVESKQTRERKSMIVVTGRKEYHNDDGLALTDLRSWLFREPATSPQAPRSPAQRVRSGTSLGTISMSEITLFRYSAITFNSHKIQ